MCSVRQARERTAKRGHLTVNRQSSSQGTAVNRKSDLTVSTDLISFVFRVLAAASSFEVLLTASLEPAAVQRYSNRLFARRLRVNRYAGLAASQPRKTSAFCLRKARPRVEVLPSTTSICNSVHIWRSWWLNTNIAAVIMVSSPVLRSTVKKGFHLTREEGSA